jgi:hypothetical protein
MRALCFGWSRFLNERVSSTAVGEYSDVHHSAGVLYLLFDWRSFDVGVGNYLKEDVFLDRRRRAAHMALLYRMKSPSSIVIISMRLGQSWVWRLLPFLLLGGRNHDPGFSWSEALRTLLEDILCESQVS